MHTWHTFAESLVALFVIANPLAVIPIFVSLTTNHSEHERKRVATVAAVTVAIVLVISIFIGDPVLKFFGIGIPAFRVAGGVLILMMAMAMLQARTSRTTQTPKESVDAAVKDDIAVVPIGIPLVAGPGAISTIIIYAHQTTNWFQTVLLIAGAVLVALSLWVSLRLADPLAGFLGQTGINIITRLLGLILMAVAVEFIASGLGQILPGLAGKA